MRGRVYTDEERGILVETIFAFKDDCKAIPGARWDKELKAWRYPATPFAARAIEEKFPPSRIAWSEDAMRLLAAAETIAEAAHNKTATTLPDIPVQRLPAWHHQKQCYWFAKPLPGAMLAADMGTGKSRMGIDLIQNREHWATLILCPKSVVSVWPGEFEKHAARRYSVIALDGGSIAQRTKELKQALELSRARLVPAVAVINYEAAWREPLADFLLHHPWDGVVLDESHRIKAPGGKAAMFCSRLGDKVPYRICLTGTPTPHSPLDIYSQYRFLDKGIFGTSFTAFRARYAVMGGFGGHQVQGYQNQAELHAKMHQIMFRVKAEDVQDLPEAVDIVRHCSLSTSAFRTYRELEGEFVTEVGAGRVTVTNALTKLLRLQQITSGFLTLDRDEDDPRAKQQTQDVDSAKAELLLDILEDLAPEEPVVVFCRFHHDLDTIREAAESLGRKCSELSGRKHELAQWKACETTVLAVQIQSGGIGIDLTRARYCIFYSLGYSLGEYLQARKRTHRPGQTRNVTYLHLVAKGTVDEKVYQALEQRQDVVEAILRPLRGGQHDEHASETAEAVGA